MVDESLKDIKTSPFRLEKEIQSLIENNIKSVFGLSFVRSEYPIEGFRFDTLCFDDSTKSFVIIEYKRDKNYSVIDQGFSYLSVMLNNKSDLILEYNETDQKKLKRDEVDWSQSKVIFISPSFSVYQKESIGFKDLPIELWEIQKFEKGVVSLIQHKSRPSSVSINEIPQSDIIKKVGKEVRSYTEEDHVEYSNSDVVKELYYKYKTRLLDMLDNVTIKYLKYYIGFKSRTNFVGQVLKVL